MGAVGLCGVIAAKRPRCRQIIILGSITRTGSRLPRDFGATDVVKERGEAAVEQVRKLTGGTGVHSILECVGTDEAIRTCQSKIARPGGAIGRVGVPHYETIPASHPGVLPQHSARRQAGTRSRVHRDSAAGHPGGPHPARSRVRSGRSGSTRFQTGTAYGNEREALKVLIEP